MKTAGRRGLLLRRHAWRSRMTLGAAIEGVTRPMEGVSAGSAFGLSPLSDTRDLCLRANRRGPFSAAKEHKAVLAAVGSLNGQ